MFSLNELSPIINWLTSLPSRNEIYGLFIIAAFIGIGTIVYFIVARKKLKKNKKVYELFKYILLVNIIIGLGLVFSSVVALESIAPYGQRWLSVFILTAWLIFMLIATWRFSSFRNVEKFDSIVSERKNNWLKKAGKKK